VTTGQQPIFASTAPPHIHNVCVCVCVCVCLETEQTAAWPLGSFCWPGGLGLHSRKTDYVNTKRVINFTLQLQSFRCCVIKYEHEWPYIKLITANLIGS